MYFAQFFNHRLGSGLECVDTKKPGLWFDWERIMNSKVMSSKIWRMFTEDYTSLISR